MKGLLVKDCKLLFQQKRMILLLLVCVAIVLGSVEDPSFIIAYAAILMLMMALGTISYDEFDNGYSFLFTLPISRKEYVAGKYILCSVYCLFTGVVAAIACAVVMVVRQKSAVSVDMVQSAICIIAVSFMILALLLPIMLKYGPEKSRIFTFAIVGVVVVFGIILGKLQEYLSIDISKVDNFLKKIGDTGFTIATVFVAVLAVMVSFVISVRIMEKKEF
ncbi:MAG: ABC-2 transporter permease [Lachnospiraceae bacterium]|nr:ABC-2 transporter permease [Lachnospiraceae bacterium]